MESNVEALQKQVLQLQEQVSVLTISHGTSVFKEGRKNEDKRHLSQNRKSQPSNSSSEFFCYRCGEDGHFATKCTSPENSSKVFQKLICALRKSKGDKEPEGKPSASVDNCSVRWGAVDSCKPNSVPEELVGPCPFANVTIESQPCKAFLDSGSRVTIVFESWYKQHIPHIPILPLTDLAIWGLSDSTYPYKGFVSVDVLLRG